MAFCEMRVEDFYMLEGKDLRGRTAAKIAEAGKRRSFRRSAS